MQKENSDRRIAPRHRQVALVAVALVVVVAAVACRPLPLGGPASRIGNDVSSCPQFQPSQSPPCGPQPMLWGAIAGPYAPFADGDPYATKCGRNLPVSEADCTGGTFAGGATNALYDPTGYEYAIDVKPADIGRTLTLQVWDAGSHQRTTGAAAGSDCNPGVAPFNAAPYSGTVSPANCQTGDTGAAPFQVQLYENDGDDLTISYSTPKAGCSLYAPATADPATSKNTWATVCSFTPTQTGVYPLRVKSSAITLPNGTAVPDTGDGSNSYALRIQNSTVTALYGLGALSVNANTPASETRFYLTDVRNEEHGKTLQVDIFDPGDGASGDSFVQILAPPSGAPNTVPSGGSAIPAAGLADSCRYNPVASPTIGPDVTAPAGAVASLCTVATRSGGVNHYENGWLSIEIKIAHTYTCLADCWWTVRYQTSGGSGVPADRMVWSSILIG